MEHGKTAKTTTSQGKHVSYQVVYRGTTKGIAMNRRLPMDPWGNMKAVAGFATELINIPFAKTGKDIQTAIPNKVAELTNAIDEITKHVEDVCKDRALDMKEVMDAVGDEEKIQTYSGKVQKPRAATLLTALDEDLNFLRMGPADIENKKERIETLQFVSKHLSPDRTYDLSLAELKALGF